MRLRTWIPWQMIALSGALLWAGCSDTPDDDAGSPPPTVEPGGETPSQPGDTPGATGTPADGTPGATSSPTDSTPGSTPGHTPHATPTPDEGTPGPTGSPAISPTPTLTPSPTPATDEDEDGYTLEDGDCDDLDPATYPAALEVPYDGTDQDCDGIDLTDVDGDGFDATEVTGGDDCDDDNVNTYPGAIEFGDGKDNDCDGQIDEGVSEADKDGDGYAESQGDCNDGDSSIHPDAVEVAYDGIDQDCSGSDLVDVDHDGYASVKVSGGKDCDDNKAGVNPAATEVCNGIDDDCDAQLDEGVQQAYYADSDLDGFGDPSKMVMACKAPLTYVADGTDCNDRNADVHPGALEVCNSKDDNCDGSPDDGLPVYTYYQDSDKDGYGNASVSQSTCTATPAGYVANAGDCNDTSSSINPAASEACNGVDDNCDSRIDEGVLGAYYPDVDQDGYGAKSGAVQACAPPTGYVTDSTDCDDSNAAVHPGATEICNTPAPLDDNCNGVIDEGVQKAWYQDSDADGYGNPTSSLLACTAPTGYVSSNGDCDDTKSAVNPAATEACNGIDDNCNSQIDENVKTTWYQDADGDGYGSSSVTTAACSKPAGYATGAGDCDDTKSSVHPGAAETCNGLDDNCDGVSDEGVKTTWYRDADGDSYGNGSVTTLACSVPSGYVANKTDCDDTNASVYPGATESCNGLDDNCDGVTDEGVKTTWYRDLDGDSYGNASVTTLACSVPAGYVANKTDCDDTNASVHPGAVETCNSLDDNCDGVIDEGVKTVYYRDADADGYGNASVTVLACSVPSGYLTDKTDCDDTKASVHPGATETCNGVDENCDGVIDEGVKTTYYRDADSDGYGNAAVTVQACSAPSGYVTNKTDCDDTKASVHPGATETCNGVDENCDGAIDEGVKTTYYQDADSDGYGNAAVTSQACTAPSGYVANKTDCDDTKTAINPGATETANGIDDNCNGLIDEGLTTQHPVQSTVGSTTLQNLSGYSNLTAGFLFAPTVPGSIKELGLKITNAGTYTVSLWDNSSQALLAQKSITVTANTYTYASITPVAVVAGQQLRVGVYIPSTGVSWSLTTGTYQVTSGNITFLNDIYGYGGVNAFPPSTDNSHRLYGLCDIGFAP